MVLTLAFFLWDHKNGSKWSSQVLVVILVILTWYVESSLRFRGIRTSSGGFVLVCGGFLSLYELGIVGWSLGAVVAASLCVARSFCLIGGGPMSGS